jgi:hypothetical protein
MSEDLTSTISNQIVGPHVSDGFYTRAPGPIRNPSHARRPSGSNNLLVAAMLRTGTVLRNTIPTKAWEVISLKDAKTLVVEWVTNRGYIPDGPETTAHPELIRYCDPKIVLDSLTHLVFQYTPRPAAKKPQDYTEQQFRTDIFIVVAKAILETYRTPMMLALHQKLTSSFPADYLSQFWTYTALQLSMSPNMITNQILSNQTKTSSVTENSMVSPTVRGRTPHGNTMAQSLFGSQQKETTENRKGTWHSTVDPSVEFSMQGTGVVPDTGKRVSPLERAFMVMMFELASSGHPAGLAATEFLASLGTKDRPVLTMVSNGQVIYNPNEMMEAITASAEEDDASEGSGSYA